MVLADRLRIISPKIEPFSIRSPGEDEMRGYHIVLRLPYALSRLPVRLASMLFVVAKGHEFIWFPM